MDNIFKGAKFGDKFITRDGRIALYSGACLNNHHYVLIDGETACLSVLSNGSCVNNAFDSPDDIVSEYQEPIDEKELVKFAIDYVSKIPTGERIWIDRFHNEVCYTEEICIAYKAGYHKAKEQ